jgi:hypothetical protein
VFAKADNVPAEVREPDPGAEIYPVRNRHRPTVFDFERACLAHPE